MRVIDSSSLITLKKLVPLTEQWPLLITMSELVRDGRLAFPRQVAAEMKVAKHPDAPGVWAAAHSGWARHRQPSDEALAEVLAVAQLTDPNSEAELEVADPYVVAMAWQIRNRSSATPVMVVTEDRIDRMPAKESIVTACTRLDLPWCGTEAFVQWLQANAPSP